MDANTLEESERSILLTDDGAVIKDCRLLGRAIREQWPVSEPLKQVAVDRLAGIIQKTTVTVATKMGPMELDGPADANAIAAVRALAQLVGQNQREDPVVIPHEHRHTHELGPITAANMEERRQQLRELAIANGHIPADRISENTGRAGGVVAVGPAEAGRASEVDRDNALGGG